jgi:hypothetical protein
MRVRMSNPPRASSTPTSLSITPRSPGGEGDQVAVRGTDQLRTGAQVAAHGANSR